MFLITGFIFVVLLDWDSNAQCLYDIISIILIIILV